MLWLVAFGQTTANEMVLAGQHADAWKHYLRVPLVVRLTVGFALGCQFDKTTHPRA